MPQTNDIRDMGPGAKDPCLLTMDLEDPLLASITRIRVVTDPDCPHWDVSYVHGLHRDGTKVRVNGLWGPYAKKPGPVAGLIADLKRAGRRDLCRVTDVLSKCW